MQRLRARGRLRGDGFFGTAEAVELESIRGYFERGQRVLEVGAGGGFQAGILSSWGCEVLAIDVPSRPRSESRPDRYPIIDYDGQHMPFRDACFDRVFSSNVLEHVDDLAQVLAETRRVLKDNGLAIHVVPSSAWRFWTILAHYGYLAKALVGRRQIATAVVVPSATELVKRRGARALGRILFPGPHGTSASAVAELSAFSLQRWREAFLGSGFSLVEVGVTPLFYTGYSLFPGLPLEVRGRLACWLGSACRVFVLAKSPV